MKSQLRLKKKVLIALTLVAVVIQLFVFFSRSWWFFELFTHYAHYYVVLGSILFVLLIFNRMWLGSLVLLSIVIINILTVAPYFKKIDPPTEEPDITILSNNFYFLNGGFHEFEDLVNNEDPDIFIVHEASRHWDNEIQTYKEQYPYLDITEEKGIHGIVIGSHIPGTFREVVLGPETGLQFTFDDKSLRILAVHPIAPLSPGSAAERNEQLEAIADYAIRSEVPTVIMGDFNATPWSPYFQDLVNNSGYLEARKGFGFLPTWHSKQPWFVLPIDHALVSPDIIVTDFYTTEKISSDHLPIVAKLALP